MVFDSVSAGFSEWFASNYKNQRAYINIGLVGTKRLMILKNVFSSFMVSYPSVQRGPRFL